MNRNTPLKPGSKGLARSPMKPGTKQLARGSPTARGVAKMRARKPVRDKPKRAARNAGPVDYLALCRGQRCYLAIDGLCANEVDTVVPCHSNSHEHGKGMGIKALDIYTVPGCWRCHAELDSGRRFSRAEKFALWEAAFALWASARAAMIETNSP